MLVSKLPQQGAPECGLHELIAACVPYGVAGHDAVPCEPCLALHLCILGGAVFYLQHADALLLSESGTV